MFAEAGFDDILYAYPLIEAHMQRNWKLTDSLENYHVMIANCEGLETLLKHEPPAGKKWQVEQTSVFSQTIATYSPPCNVPRDRSVFLNIDCGYGREGFWWEDKDLVVSVARGIAENEGKIRLMGIYAHCGNSYSGESVEETKKVFICRLVCLLKRLLENQTEVRILSLIIILHILGHCAELI